MRFSHFLLLGCLLSGLVAQSCMSSVVQAPVVEPMGVSYATPTSTIQWFPPTATATKMPTRAVTSTPDWHPGLGSLTVSDNFTDKTQWETGEKSVGSIAYSHEKLTLAISKPSGTLYSFRKAQVASDFYLTIRANPVLCKQADAYGVMFRVNSNMDFYRLLINCNGLLRLERVRNGNVTVLQDWLPSGQIAAGAPMDLEIGIWAVNQDLRIFINDIYQFGKQR